MFKSKFKKIILAITAVYFMIMLKFYLDYQAFTSMLLENNDWLAAEASIYVLRDMRMVTFFFGCAIVCAFVARAYLKKSNFDKSKKKAIQLAQSGKFKDACDIQAVVDLEFKGAANLWDDEFTGEINKICKISMPDQNSNS
jgi:hypothetical protein